MTLLIGEMEGRSYEATCPNKDCKEHGTAFVHDDLAGDTSQDAETAECPECSTPLVWDSRLSPTARSGAVISKMHSKEKP